ncbi:hypothetical protein D9V32_09035 [Mycetocola tolaasinivorans]|uniref:Glutaminase n=1 Tax=Mycetocola tolaasinivorans TaxID=76635 RepID=A0A3L7A5U9_9MICO|nr:hypothetical protein [Mycetocola tolaasinivorans]RLP75607.1 hypothetical protein D9V32_09035 [Mycetocola tolaasinivorans]
MSAHPQTAAILADAVAALRAHGTAPELRAEFVPAHTRLLVPRRAAILPIGEVWRLGSLLLGPDGDVYETGEVVRASEPGWPGHQSVLAEQRREYRQAAQRAKIASGTVINLGWTPVDLEPNALRDSDGVLVLRGETPHVRWAPGSDAATLPLDSYLAERITLLASTEGA